MSIKSSKSNISQLILSASIGAGLMWFWQKKSEKKLNKMNENFNMNDINNYNNKEFDEIFHEFVNEFLEECANKYEMDHNAIERLKRVMNYSCIGGKLNRGRSVVKTVLDICKQKKINFLKRKRKAMALGWAIEALQASFLVADDIMDASVQRRGQPCWYLVEDVQMDAVNDVLIIESFIYFLLKRYFEHDDIYVQLIELYREVSLQTQLGQMLDLVSNPQGRPKDGVLDTFSIDLQRKIVQYKTAYYTFYLPFASGMILCGMSSPSQLKLAERLSIELGVKFQIQDDYLDCYGDPEKIGKIGTDIKDHKCTWLVVQAMKRASSEQMKILREHYGKEESEHIIKKLYDDLELESVYLSQEQTSYDRINELLDLCDVENIPRSIFESMLKKIHLRQK